MVEIDLDNNSSAKYKDALKSEIQSFFSDGLVIIIGSGLSVAEGVSGMSSLTNHLRSSIHPLLNSNEEKEWEAISNALEEGKDLESVLQLYPPSDGLEKQINILTGKLIEEDESSVIKQVIENRKKLRLSYLLDRCLVQESVSIPVITTNYDRLIEFAAYQTGLGVDSLFVGTDFGSLNHKESHYSHCRGIKTKNKRAILRFHPRIKVLKPHGSLDWYKTDNGPLKSSLKLDLPRLIITPGQGKYKAGYESPFDKHRDIANDHIEKSERFLIIGYGFNDNHLQNHLERYLKQGRPALIITRSLSNSALALLDNCENMICICRHNFQDGRYGTSLIKKRTRYTFEDCNWWDIEEMSKDILCQ